MITPEQIAQIRQAAGANPSAQNTESLVSRLGIQPEKEKTFMEKAEDVATTIFPVKNIGDAIGTAIAKKQNPEQAQYLTSPSAKDIAGDVIQTAAFFTPVGKIAQGFSLGSKALGLGARYSSLLGKVASGTLTGYTIDVGMGLSNKEENPFKPGLGTAIGTAVPLVAPVTRGLARVSGEILGKTTGTSYGAIKQGFQAAKEGGEKAKSFRGALRGDTSPEQLVEEARTGLETIKNTRRENYLNSLKQVKEFNENLNIAPIVKEVGSQLKKFNIGVLVDGALDFSRSSIRFDKQAQNDIIDIVNTMRGFGLRSGDRTVVGVDLLKQALSDKYNPSSSVRAFVQAVKDQARKVAGQVPGYNEMTGAYEKSSELINEISRGLSLGDKASVDTAFRKLTLSLRQNNEMRQQLVSELDQATGGALSSKIAGQQLSAILPRGLSGVFAGTGGAVGLASGIGIVPILKVAALTSPRLIGELVNALGFTGKVASNLVRYIEKNIGKLQSPGDAILKRVEETTNK